MRSSKVYRFVVFHREIDKTNQEESKTLKNTDQSYLLKYYELY